MKLQFLLPLQTFPNTDSSFIIPNAVDVSLHVGATLHSCAFEVVIPESTSSLSSPIEVDGIISRAETFSKEQAVLLTKSVEQLALVANFDAVARILRVAEPLVVDTLVEMARCYDLIILDGSVDFYATNEAVLVGSGRPVLICPPRQICARFDHIAVAWDAGRAASRALADAANFIERATKVTLLSMTDEKPRNSGQCADIVDTLQRKGINVERHEILGNGEPIGDKLQEYASKIGADLLVTGGFGHSRQREFVLGGVTRSLLSNTRMPLLMSH